MTTQNAISWPEKYLPGTGDNFVSDEVIVEGVTVDRVWRYLTDTSAWESYHDNVADISFPQGGGPELKDGQVFSFGTFGFPPLDARVVEYQAPAAGVSGRLSWTSCTPGWTA
ncbi:SRPBCC family protein [Streptomyces sp. NPDC059627]